MRIYLISTFVVVQMTRGCSVKSRFAISAVAEITSYSTVASKHVDEFRILYI